MRNKKHPWKRSNGCWKIHASTSFPRVLPSSCRHSSQRAKHKKRVVGDWRETMAKAVASSDQVWEAAITHSQAHVPQCILRAPAEWVNSGSGAPAFCLRVSISLNLWRSSSRRRRRRQLKRSLQHQACKTTRGHVNSILSLAPNRNWLD